MIFHTTHRYTSSMSADEIHKKLVGQHVKVHGLDFEIFDKAGMLKIIPHAEQVQDVKSLPIGHIHLSPKGSDTAVRFTTKMRRIDAGGPTLVALFSCFMMIAGAMFYIFGGSEFVRIGIPVFAIGLFVFIILFIRLQQGYYDYCKKLKAFVRSQTAPK